MPSYLVTGASRGIGFEFVRQLSAKSENIVVGLVRNKTDADKKVAEQLPGRTNLHTIQADISDYDSLKKSVDLVSEITHGSLDYLVGNAGFISQFSGNDSFGTLANQPSELEQDLLKCFRVNVIGNVHLVNLYIPLIRKGAVKKVILISSGHASYEMITELGLDNAAPYAISKAGLNIAVAKFHAEYSTEGILFLGLCPGPTTSDAVEDGVAATEEQLARANATAKKFQKHAPGFTQPHTPEDAVNAMMFVIRKASLERGYGGGFRSHLDSKTQWL